MGKLWVTAWCFSKSLRAPVAPYLDNFLTPGCSERIRIWDPLPEGPKVREPEASWILSEPFPGVPNEYSAHYV